jgi:hypothetical protein
MRVWKSLAPKVQFSHLQASMKNLENIASFFTIISSKNMIDTL